MKLPDPLALGLVGLAEVIPYFSTALFAGYAVDHYSRRLLGALFVADVSRQCFDTICSVGRLVRR